MLSARERLASTTFDYYPLLRLADSRIGDPRRLPVTVKILLEGLLRGVERGQVNDVSLRALARWPEPPPAGAEVPYLPSHPAAGFHRRAGRRRPGGHAIGDAACRQGCGPDRS